MVLKKQRLDLYNHLPSWLLWVVNGAFWLVVSSLVSISRYQQARQTEPCIEFYEVWLKCLPCWVNWILLVPVIIATGRILSSSTIKLRRLLANSILISACSLAMLWILIIAEYALISSFLVVPAGEHASLQIGAVDQLLARSLYV